MNKYSPALINIVHAYVFCRNFPRNLIYLYVILPQTIQLFWQMMSTGKQSLLLSGVDLDYAEKEDKDLL